MCKSHETNKLLSTATTASHNCIQYPSDSALVLEEIHDKWPTNVRDTTAAFDLGISQHRTNIEALTEISILSKCTYLLHGLSAMSEAAVSRSFFVSCAFFVHELNTQTPLTDVYQP